MEGDHIKEIEAVSDDWWQGKDQHGSVGLFPGGLNFQSSEMLLSSSCFEMPLQQTMWRSWSELDNELFV